MSEMVGPMIVSTALCDGCGCMFALGEGETVLDYVIDSPSCTGVYCLFCRATGGFVDEALK